MSNELENTKKSINDSVYEEIKNRILEGVYEPGSKLVTQSIAEELGVSRTPVVMAVNRLAAEGLATAQAQHGVYVKQITASEIKEILELRLMIEIQSIDSILKNVVFNAEALEKLKKAAEGYKDIEPYNYNKMMKVEVEFHSIFVGLMENELVLKIYKQYRCVEAIIDLYRSTNMSLETFQDAYREHISIVDYLERRDEEKLRHLLMKHIEMPLYILEWMVKAGKISV